MAITDDKGNHVLALCPQDTVGGPKNSLTRDIHGKQDSFDSDMLPRIFLRGEEVSLPFCDF